MEHVIRIAFWIFTLFFALSDCNPTSTVPRERLKNVDFNIDFLQKDVSCPSDTSDTNGTRLYSPENVEIKCFTDALNCIFKELNGTTRVECEDKHERINQAVEALEEWIQHLKEELKAPVPTNSEECACEKWKAVPFDKFLTNYKDLTELINTFLISQYKN